MLDMGFQPQVDKIVDSCSRERQTMLFSATLDGEIGKIAASYTRTASRFERHPQSGGSSTSTSSDGDFK